MNKYKSPRNRRWIFVLCALPGTLFLLLLTLLAGRNPYGPLRFTLFDDAMISMSYARTLANTGEFVWFPNAPRVQGITNPLWTIWMAIIHLLNLGESLSALVITLTGVVILVLTSWTIFQIASEVLPSFPVWTTASASSFVLFMFPTTYWTLRGMEVGLLSLVMARLILVLIKSHDKHENSPFIHVWTLMVLGVLIRFDFLFVCFIVFGYLSWTAPKNNRLKLSVINTVFTVAMAFGVCLFQRIYWGSWLPNTYHLKMDGVSTWTRIERGISVNFKAVPLIVIICVTMLFARPKTVQITRALILSTTLFSSFFIYSTYIGGDAWEDMMLNRFISTGLPLIPLIALLVFSTTGEKLHRLSNILPIIVTAAAVVSSGLIPITAQIRERDVLFTRTNHFVTESAIQLNDLVEDNAEVATVWAGIPAYYLQRPMLDLLGKNDRHIAHSTPHGSFFPGHNKWDYEYSITTFEPDVIFQTFTRGLEPDLNQRLETWGYKRMCTRHGVLKNIGVFFKRDSSAVKWQQLTECNRR